MNKIKVSELFEVRTEFLKGLFSEATYPWELLPKIKDFSMSLIQKGIEGYTLISGNILIGPGVKIYPTATIEGPAVIGSGTEIRPGAFIRGNALIGENCVIGNSTEIKNSILLNDVQVPHYNYIGDSILGNYAHTGAATICSNLKADGKNVVVHSEIDYKTELRKLGAILADGVNIGCGVVLNPGTVIGKGTVVYPKISLRGVYPPDSIVKSEKEIVKKAK